LGSSLDYQLLLDVPRRIDPSTPKAQLIGGLTEAALTTHPVGTAHNRQFRRRPMTPAHALVTAQASG
jgi:hypothetical protein